MAKIGLVQTAHIHTPGFVKMLKARTDITVAGVYEPDDERAAKWTAELGVPRVDCYKKLLSDPTVDGIVVCGTTAQHDGVVEAVAKAGKALFVEKPLATTPGAAWKIYTAIKEAGVMFQTGHFMRSEPAYQFAKAQVAAGNLGTVTRVRHANCHSGALGGWFNKEYRWFFDKAAAGGGGFYDLGCHSVDILLYILGGAITEATAALSGKTIVYPQIDEYGEGLMRFRDGTIGSVAAGWVSVANPVALEISGTEGHLWVSNGKVFMVSPRSGLAGADGKQPLEASLLPAGRPHAFELYLDVLVGKADKSVLIPVEEALQVCLAMDAMYRGHQIGGWVKV
jgi:predicted dehydrogenase